MNKIIFPRKEHQRYYRYHYNFLLNIFQEANVILEIGPSTELDTTRFTLNIDGENICIDFSDHTELYKNHKSYKHYFKYHYTESLHKKYSHVYPLSPISFLDWKRYFTLEKEITYTCNNNIILNNQRPYAGALKRRRKVQHLLASVYKTDVDFKLTSQLDYWKKINNCLVGVFVPGARNDMLDRAEYQFLAFGCYVISPYIKTILPYNQKLIPGIHYISCKSDYSDLIEKIEWCKNNRKKCIEIGKNAKHLFMAFCLPRQIVRWMELILSKG